MKSNHRLNELMMANRRRQPPLSVESKLENAIHAPPLLPAAVAYLTLSDYGTPQTSRAPCARVIVTEQRMRILESSCHR